MVRLGASGFGGAGVGFATGAGSGVGSGSVGGGGAAFGPYANRPAAPGEPVLQQVERLGQHMIAGDLLERRGVQSGKHGRCRPLAWRHGAAGVPRVEKDQAA